MRRAVLFLLDQRLPPPELAEALSGVGLFLDAVCPAPRDRVRLEGALRLAAGRPGVRLVLTAGGAGVCPGDTAPEALEGVCDRAVPGVPEAVRSALPPEQRALFRGRAGLRGGTLVINLPGGTGAQTALSAVLPALDPLLTAAAR